MRLVGAGASPSSYNEGMVSNVLALKRLQSGFNALPFHSPHKGEEDQFRAAWGQILNASGLDTELERAFDELAGLLSPLCGARTEEAVSEAVETLLPHYGLWKVKLSAVLVNSLEEGKAHEFLHAYGEGMNEAQHLFDRADTSTSEETAELLHSAFEGIALYSENMLGALLEDGRDALNEAHVEATFNRYLKADLLVLTAAMMINGELQGWDHQTLAGVASQADVHVEAIEDYLIGHDPALRERLQDDTDDSISLDEMMRQLDSA